MLRAESNNAASTTTETNSSTQDTRARGNTQTEPTTPAMTQVPCAPFGEGAVMAFPPVPAYHVLLLCQPRPSGTTST